MAETRNPDRSPKPQARPRRPDRWRPDLNPSHRAGAKIGQESDAQVEAAWTAFHLRKRGLDMNAVNDEEPGD